MKSKKEPKLSKKEQRKLDALKKAEEERKAKEAERIRLEEEENIRREKEAKRLIEEQKFMAEEAVRLADEESKFKTELINLKGTLKNVKKAVKSAKELEKILQCSPKTDVDNEKDVTTFISQFIDYKNFPHLNIVPMLNYIQEAIDVDNAIGVKILQYEYSTKKEIVKKTNLDFSDQKNKIKYKNINLTELSRLERYKLYSYELRRQILKKIDLITSPLILNADEIQKNEEAKRPAENLKKDTNQFEYIIQRRPDLHFGMFIPWPYNVASRNTQRQIDFKEIVIFELKPTSKLVCRGFWLSFDYISSEKYSKDWIVGGLLDVTFLESKLEIKDFKNWRIKQDYQLKQSITKVPYQTDGATTSSFTKIQYTLPPYIYINSPTEKLRVLMLNKNNEWSQENVEEVRLSDPEKKIVIVSVSRFSILGLAQDRCTDYPHRSWRLRCINEKTAYLDIYSKRLQIIRFEIGPGYVKLRNRPEKEFQHIVNQPFEPSKILTELRRCGILLTPRAEDAEQLNISKKSKEAEYNALEDLVISARAYYIKSSRWNMSLPADRVMVRMKENIEYDEDFLEDQEKEWKSIVWWKDKCAIINAREDAEVLNETRVEDTTTHINIFLLLKKHNLAKYDVLGRIMDTNYILFSNSLKKLLQMLRLLSFTLSQQL